MYAAQYDLPDALTILLARRADVTKVTDAKNVTDANIQFDNRTALMYAAENASESVIDRLIQAGSDLCATDSGKRDLRDYLSRNRRLSEAARGRFADVFALKWEGKRCVRVGGQDNRVAPK